MADLLDRSRSLDRLGENVAHGVHEVDLVARELAFRQRVHAQKPPRALGGMDGHHEPAERLLW
jgi:hypothetical protein